MQDYSAQAAPFYAQDNQQNQIMGSCNFDSLEISVFKKS